MDMYYTVTIQYTVAETWGDTQSRPTRTDSKERKWAITNLAQTFWSSTI